MSMFGIFDAAGTAMSAQTVRLNTVASNLANADVVAGDAQSAYRARMPVFSSVLADQDGGPAGVRVDRIVSSAAEPQREYAPQHPQADAEGYIYHSNVNVVEEMANMTSASRSYQTNVEIVSTVKRLMLSTLRLGQ
ncbi:MAG: flagellar basal body rod protein FlgC [Pseudomonadales bacterium]|jgi:flagellar basal-body rod protein FlgC|nr:flagellar basal body rod protein FlgC [Pseudomonadales bacterium]